MQNLCARRLLHSWFSLHHKQIKLLLHLYGKNMNSQQKCFKFTLDNNFKTQHRIIHCVRFLRVPTLIIVEKCSTAHTAVIYYYTYA